MEKGEAAFGAGCFWHVQEAFDKVSGVEKTEVGYMGGDEKKFSNPTYEQVSSDKTGYVETVYLKFNPKKVSYEKLLEIFWENHDPTSVDRQGLDAGSQYRSVIFYYNQKQKLAAEKSKKLYQKKTKKKIVTEIKRASKFFKAEEYHQKYYKKHKLICKVRGMFR